MFSQKFMGGKVYNAEHPLNVSFHWWQDLFEIHFGEAFLDLYVQMGASVLNPKEVGGELVAHSEKLLNSNFISIETKSHSQVLQFSTLGGIFNTICKSYTSQHGQAGISLQSSVRSVFLLTMSSIVWGDLNGRILNCVDRAVRICSPFNIPETSKLIISAFAAGISSVDHLKKVDDTNLRNLSPLHSTVAPPSASSIFGSFSKWKSPTLQLG